MSSRVPVSEKDRAALARLDARIKAMLPEEYQCYADVQPVSMGTAPLKYGPDGRVAWDEMWTSYCDLALAGGPPHRGKLLPAVRAEEARSRADEYQVVVDELARAIWLVTQLRVLPRLAPGWVGVVCSNKEMAAWLVRAILVENVFARRDGAVLHLPAGPGFRIDKEIKNVVTALAKTHHYWTAHARSSEREAVVREAIAPACVDEVDAAPEEYRTSVAAVQAALATTELPVCTSSPGWVGIECADVEMSIWLLRALLVENVLARREERTLFLPVGPGHLAEGKVARETVCLSEASRLWGVAQLISAADTPAAP